MNIDNQARIDSPQDVITRVAGLRKRLDDVDTDIHYLLADLLAGGPAEAALLQLDESVAEETLDDIAERVQRIERAVVGVSSIAEYLKEVAA